MPGSQENRFGRAALSAIEFSWTTAIRHQTTLIEPDYLELIRLSSYQILKKLGNKSVHSMLLGIQLNEN